jgi:branched-chain amino acid transport system permease protein
MGFGVFLIALVAVVIGGDSIVANAVVALFLGVLQQTAALILPTHWQDAVVFLVLVVFLLLKPAGIFGRSPRKAGV